MKRQTQQHKKHKQRKNPIMYWDYADELQSRIQEELWALEEMFPDADKEALENLARKNIKYIISVCGHAPVQYKGTIHVTYTEEAILVG